MSDLLKFKEMVLTIAPRQSSRTSTFSVCTPPHLPAYTHWLGQTQPAEGPLQRVLLPDEPNHDFYLQSEQQKEHRCPLDNVLLKQIQAIYFFVMQFCHVCIKDFILIDIGHYIFCVMQFCHAYISKEERISFYQIRTLLLVFVM